MKALFILLITASVLTSCAITPPRVFMTKSGQRIIIDSVAGYTSIAGALNTESVQIDNDNKKYNSLAQKKTYEKYSAALDDDNLAKADTILNLADRLSYGGGSAGVTGAYSGKKISVSFKNTSTHFFYITEINGLGISPEGLEIGATSSRHLVYNGPLRIKCQIYDQQGYYDKIIKYPAGLNLKGIITIGDN